MRFVKERSTIVRLDIPSRLVQQIVYRAYVKYQPYSRDALGGIVRYCFDCENSTRTVGCCSYVAVALQEIKEEFAALPTPTL